MSRSPAAVLIVDDDVALLQALPQMLALRLPDLEVETADSALAALKQIELRAYAAIVSDIKMPGMDGLALLIRIKEMRPETPTLLITGHGEHDLAIQALRGGAYDFIQKPINRDYFIAALQRAMQTHHLRRQVQEQQRALEQYAQSLEVLVQERTRQLMEANAAKDAFLSVASHELRTPLTSLKVLIQLLRRRYEQRVLVSGISSTELANMERSIHRMELLVNDLLDTSLVQTGMFALHLQRCDLITLCRHILEEHIMGTTRSVTFAEPAVPLEVEVDVDRISQVVLNLLSNAHKYSPPEAPITLTLEQAGDSCKLSVQDHGMGIPAEEVPHIFERFYRVPGSANPAGSNAGIGLGLYVAKTIVERHGGHIEVQSHPGRGSTFSIVLPLTVQLPTSTEVDASLPASSS